VEFFLLCERFFFSVRNVSVNFKTGKNYSLQLGIRMFSGHNDKSHFQESKYLIDIFYATIFSNDQVTANDDLEMLQLRLLTYFDE